MEGSSSEFVVGRVSLRVTACSRLTEKIALSALEARLSKTASDPTAQRGGIILT